MQTWLVIAARSAGNMAEKAESTTEPAGAEELAGQDQGPNEVMAETHKRVSGVTNRLGWMSTYLKIRSKKS